MRRFFGYEGAVFVEKGEKACYMARNELPATRKKEGQRPRKAFALVFYLLSEIVIDLITGCLSMGIVPLLSVGCASVQILSTTSIPETT